VLQGRASIGGVGVEMLRVVVVVVVVPLLLLVAEFASCVASCPGPVVLNEGLKCECLLHQLG
jgi:hypothetical protein